MEHVGINVMKNYLPTMRKAALIFMTTSRWGGWHHVEVHSDEWWIRKFETFGFKYDEALTLQVRSWAKQENGMKKSHPFSKTKGYYNPQHIWLSMKVFVNPVVASLPQHDHLFYEPGCYDGRKDGEIQHRKCGEKTGTEESVVPDSFQPIKLSQQMDIKWQSLVLKAMGQPAEIPTEVADQTGQIGKPVPKIDIDKLPSQEIPEVLQRIKDRNFTDMAPVPILAWPYAEKGVNTAEHKHVEENGILESPHLEMTKDLFNFDPNIVWIGDTGWGVGWNLWCEAFYNLILESMSARLDRGLPPRWPIVIVDFTDQANMQRCRNIERLMGLDYLRYTKRSMGKGRMWLVTKKWVTFGYHLNQTTDAGYTYKHTPLVVRTDTIESLKGNLKGRGLNLTSPIHELPRATDVIHLWPLNSTKVNVQYAFLRNKVSEIIIDMSERHNINSFVGLAGKPLREGRRDVQEDYINILLDTKIVVITQRDYWEDHYRLMEALVSGTCVLTDFMHGLPEGLKNGTSILEYKSPQDLESLILYYLKHDKERIEIGRRGREVAMSQHRTWHRMEEIVFGEILTTCESKQPGSDCPYIVHANE